MSNKTLTEIEGPASPIFRWSAPWDYYQVLLDPPDPKNRDRERTITAKAIPYGIRIHYLDHSREGMGTYDVEVYEFDRFGNETWPNERRSYKYLKSIFPALLNQLLAFHDRFEQTFPFCHTDDPQFRDNLERVIEQLEGQQA